MAIASSGTSATPASATSMAAHRGRRSWSRRCSASGTRGPRAGGRPCARRTYGPAQSLQGSVPVAADAARFAIEEAEPRVLLDRFLGKLLKPLVDKAETAFGDDVLAVLGDEPRSLALEPGTQVVVDRLRPLRRCLEIRRGMDVEPGDLCLGALRDQAALEETAEQVVVSEALLVQAVCEQAAVFQVARGTGVRRGRRRAARLPRA